MVRVLVILLLLLCFVGQAEAQSLLSKTAAGLSPGSWSADLGASMPGFDTGNVFRPPPGNIGSLLEFTDKACSWDQVNATILCLGGSHTNVSPPPGTLATKFLRYTDSTATWINSMPNPVPNFDTAWPDGAGGGGIGHDYNHDTIDAAGNYYHRQYGDTGAGSKQVMKFSQDGQSWSQCTPIPGNTNVGEALEYFPDRNSLVYMDGDWGVYELSLASGNCLGSWVARAGTGVGPGGSPPIQLVGIESYHGISRYSGLCHCIIMGGGNDSLGGISRTLWRMYADATFVVVAAPPAAIDRFSIAFNDGTPRGTVQVVDPVSGKFLVWHSSNASTTMYEYDPVANTWATISRASPMFFGPEGGVTETVALATPYNAILFVQAGSSSGGQVRLYQHAAGEADVTAPTVPSALTVKTASASQIDLSWSASTDAQGVAGYKIYRCTGAACNPTVLLTSVGGTSYSDTGLSASTLYRYAVSAFDGATNESAMSTVAEDTTSSSGGGDDFATRCKAAGVIKCVSFDSNADLGVIAGLPSAPSVPTVVFHNSQVTCNTTASDHCPTIDTNVKASGDGSLKIVVGAGQPGSDGGQWGTQFYDDFSGQFGAGQTFYLSWRMRFDDNYIAAARSGNTIMKQSMVGTGTSLGDPQYTCTDLEVVTQANDSKGVFGWYHNCGLYQGFETGPFVSQWTSIDYNSQNGRPYTTGGGTADGVGCWHYAPNFASRQAPLGNCIAYEANTWQAVKVQLQIGTVSGNYYNNSVLNTWVAADGGPWVKVIDNQIRNLGPMDTPIHKYGAVWFLTYSAGNYANGGTVWYDDLIISSEDITAPGGTIAPPSGVAVSRRRTM